MSSSECATDGFRAHVQFIVSPGYHGHRLMYAALAVDESLQLGRSPVLLLPHGAVESDEFRLHIARFGTSILVEEVPEFSVAKLRSRVPDDSAFPTVFIEADTWLLPLILGAPRWPGGTNLVIMRPGASGTSITARITGALKPALRLWARTFTDHRPWKLMSFTTGSLRPFEIRDPVSFAGDPAQACELRKEWTASAAPGVESWAGILGAIGKRKNVELVARAISNLDGRVGLVLAGPPELNESEVEDWILPLRKSRRVVRIARHMTDGELDSVILALDCVVLAHSNEGPSGILARALISGARAVTAGALSLRADASRMPERVNWVPLEADSIGAAIDAAIRQGRTSGFEHSDTSFARLLVNSA